MGRLLAAVTAAVAGLAVGCAGVRPADLTLEKMKARVNAPAPATGVLPPTPAVSKAVTDPEPVKGVPATEFTFGWQSRLAQLPDPTRGGAMNPGLVGQVFLFTRDLKPADITGQLTVAVSDATPRSLGRPPHTGEAWNFTPEVLRTKVVHDERFGRSVVVFLPWPDAWRDVTVVSIQARYDQPNGETLIAQPTTVTLDFTDAPGQPAVRPGMASAGLPAIPDPRVVLKQARANGGLPPAFGPAAGGVQQAAGAIPMNLGPAPGGVQPAGGFPLPQAGRTAPHQAAWPAPQLPPPAAPPGDGMRIVIPRG